MTWFATDAVDGPHANQPVATTGASPDEADAAVVLAHGRGATAEGILDLADEFRRENVAYVAPQAAGNEWYPQSFLASIDANEPHLSSALALFGTVVDGLAAAGVAPERTLLSGFSQGACLTTEYAARNARRYGGVAGLSGGLIGPDGTPRDYDGSLDGTPVYLGCGDRDPHIPVERVEETTATFRDLDGDVTEQIFEGMGHGVVKPELDAVEAMLDVLLDGGE